MMLSLRDKQRLFGVLGALFLVSLLCVPCGFPIAPAQFVFYLAVGWAFFLKRTLAEIDIVWVNVAFASLAFAVFAIGLHGFMRWVSLAWPLRKSLAATTLVAALFVAGMAGVGIVHQTVWMFGDGRAILDGGFTAHFRSTSQNNLHQIGLAAHNYADAYDSFPPGGMRDEQGRMLHGWHTLMRPFLGDRMEEGIDYGQPWDSATNARHFKAVIPAYIAPWRGEARLFDERGFAISHYTGNALVMGGDRSVSFQQIKDGTSNTILVGEAVDRPLAWGFPGHWRDPRLGISQSPQGFGGWSKVGADFVFTDASTKFISKDVDPRVLEAITTPAGRENVSLNDF